MLASDNIANPSVRKANFHFKYFALNGCEVGKKKKYHCGYVVLRHKSVLIMKKKYKHKTEFNGQLLGILLLKYDFPE